jgi:hypothetical protein
LVPGGSSRNINSAEKAGYFFEGALGGGKADALDGLFGHGFEPFERERQVSAALGGDEGVDLVDDDGVYGAERFRGLRSEQQIERLGRGDEDFGRGLAEAGAFFLRGVAGAYADLRVMHRDAHAPRHVGDAGEWRAQVAFDIDSERFER